MKRRLPLSLLPLTVAGSLAGTLAWAAEGPGDAPRTWPLRAEIARPAGPARTWIIDPERATVSELPARALRD
ncbi:hypothetical protein KM176_15255 [Pseudooceanicola sp. CBS1P-1]|uniref:Uncharacterized protein n=1 Tax=Pseudooceanicola albus TaxID=2692189 RepID=A0A6L7G5B4_9RHOB|nr:MULTISPECIES: hypothetical protein [Pseudooceanicola]MBT9385228.1 hypothetical protein [Pseudooceanicola endophyticus]MXN18688.1 hypothetical protein [Pseudooceanicola albus]